MYRLKQLHIIKISRYLCYSLLKGDVYKNLNLWCFGDVEEIPFVEEAKEERSSFNENSSVPSELKENIDKWIDYWSKESKDRTGIKVVCL